MTRPLIILGIILITGGPALSVFGFIAPVDLHPTYESLPLYAVNTGIALYILGVILLIFAAWGV